MASAGVPKTCKVVTADTIAKKLLSEALETLSSLQGKEEGKEAPKPCLVAFLANDDPAAAMYAEWSKKTCEEKGFHFDLRHVKKEELKDAISAANDDNAVDGIIVYYPIWPDNPDLDRGIRSAVDMKKDVEGLHPEHLDNMYNNVRFLDRETRLRKSLLPCTPLAIVKALEHLQVYNSVLEPGNRLFGKTVAVVNRSEVNGQPLAALLANDGAAVYSVDLTGVQLFTRGRGIRRERHQVHDMPADWTLASVLPLSDVVVSGVPADGFKVPADLLRDGAVCINFSSARNFDGPAVKERASIYVPSVGKVTIAVLLRNLVRLIANRPQPGGATQPEDQKARSEVFMEG